MTKAKQAHALEDRTYPFSIQRLQYSDTYDVVDLRYPEMVFSHGRTLVQKSSDTGIPLFKPIASGCTNYYARVIAELLNERAGVKQTALLAKRAARKRI